MTSSIYVLPVVELDNNNNSLLIFDPNIFLVDISGEQKFVIKKQWLGEVALEFGTNEGHLECYAHIGQHSNCHADYILNPYKQLKILFDSYVKDYEHKVERKILEPINFLNLSEYEPVITFDKGIMQIGIQRSTKSYNDLMEQITDLLKMVADNWEFIELDVLMSTRNANIRISTSLPFVWVSFLFDALNDQFFDELLETDHNVEDAIKTYIESSLEFLNQSLLDYFQIYTRGKVCQSIRK